MPATSHEVTQWLHEGSNGDQAEGRAMMPERWQQIEELYHAVRERAPAERAAWLAEACAGDEALRREVASLLAFDAQAGDFIETPPDDIAAGLMAEGQTRAMVGRTLGHYRLQSLLGAGGMGEVYRARDTRLDRDVAVKILPEHLADNEEALRRFEREAKAVAALSHPNILAIHDFGVEQGVSYAVMELLEGETLRARLQPAALPWREAVQIGLACAEGLAAAHAKGIIHRDLKPENIFLTTDGQVKILDFGIARVKRVVTAESGTATETTQPGTVLGTLGYMSPEQVRGEEADAPSDIFSFGCVLYEMVSGQRPFARVTAAEVIAAILKEEPPTLAATGREIPVGLERLIRGCLAKQASARLPAARALADDLKAIADRHETQRVFPARARPRQRPAAMLGAAAVVLLLGVLAWVIFSGRREPALDSLAVLPLTGASSDEQTEILSDGLSESIINSLSQLPQLKRVIARSTAATYKGKEIDPRKVGQELNVRAVLIGKMIRRSDDLLIEAELVNTADGSRLWGGQYPLKPADVLAVQTEIAKQISEKLRLRLTGVQQQRLTKRYTENTEAYLLYNKGRYYSLNFWTANGFKQGLGYLNQAIALDPTYALAQAGLAATYYDASGVWLTPNDAMPKAKAAALKALELDEELAEAHTALAQVQARYDWDWPEAEKHYRRALELNPNFAPAHLYYGFYLADRGRVEAGITEMKQAQRLDPLTPSAIVLSSLYYYGARRYDEVISECQQIIRTNPDFAMTHWMLGLVYEQQEKLAQALAEFKEAERLDPEQPFHLGYLGHAYALLGKRDEALGMIAEMQRRAKLGTYVDPFPVALVYVGLGEQDEAFRWLEKAYQERSESLLIYKDAPVLDSLRTDPRFKDLLRRMNLAP